MWAASGFTYSVALSVTSAKAGATAPSTVVTESLQPQAIVPLYTFTSANPDGVWNITLGGQQGTFVIPVRFVNVVQDQPVSLGPLQYSLDGGNISISAQASFGDSYDQEVCAVGASSGPGITLSLPRDMQDIGKISLIPGSPLTVLTSGEVNESTSFWFELYHPYGLDVASANSVVVSDLMTAESQPVALASNAASAATLTWNMALREGRYDLRAFFQNSTSLDVIQSRVLIVNDSSWVSLSDSCPPQTVQSQDVSYSSSLTGGQASWPRTLYVMYRTFGVEAVASYPVMANLSSVNFVASPWNQSLPDVKVNVSPAPGILQSSQEGSSLFVLASQYPVQLHYSLDIGGGNGVAQGSVTLDGSYATQTETLGLAKLTVQVLGGQSSPTSLGVTGPQGVSIASGLVGNNQTTSFLLPTGSYTVTGSQAGNSQTTQVSLTDGFAATVTLNFNAVPSLEIILVVTAVVAVIANVLVWAFRSRSLGSRMASASKGS